MTNDEMQQTDEIGRLIASDPHANLVEGNQQIWLLTGKALNLAKAAFGQPDLDDSRPVAQNADEVGPSQH